MSQDTSALITIGISTTSERAARLTLPAPHDQIVYVIVIQGPERDLTHLDRTDTRVIPQDAKGLSRSRNLVLDSCHTDYLLFSDDDVGLELDGIIALQRALSETSNAIGAGWRKQSYQRYARAPHRHRLTRRNSGRICAPEFMVRVPLINAKRMRFDVDFGVGSDTPIGEDFIFVTDILAAGLKGEGFPIITGSHPHESSGDNWSSQQLLKSRRKVIRRAYPRFSLLIAMAYVAKHRRQFTVRDAIRFLCC